MAGLIADLNNIHILVSSVDHSLHFPTHSTSVMRMSMSSDRRFTKRQACASPLPPYPSSLHALRQQPCAP